VSVKAGKLSWLLGFLRGTRVNGQPSPNDIAKAATSDGVGPHAHGDFGLHEHGGPTFSDAEMAMLEAKGLHVDNHHGRVYDATGFLLSPGTVGAMLSEARQGTLKADDGGDAGGNLTTKMASAVDVGGEAPGEAARTQGSVAAQHLDLRGEWPVPS
jgi:hypothetical protein